jgi:hypothetical protein
MLHERSLLFDPETVIDDGSIFPIVAGKYFKLQPQYSYYNPTMLSIDIRAALHENWVSDFTGSP